MRKLFLAHFVSETAGKQWDQYRLTVLTSEEINAALLKKPTTSHEEIASEKAWRWFEKHLEGTDAKLIHCMAYDSIDTVESEDTLTHTGVQNWKDMKEQVKSMMTAEDYWFKYSIRTPNHPTKITEASFKAAIREAQGEGRQESNVTPISREFVKTNQVQALAVLGEMCAQSLDPDTYAKWEEVREMLYTNRNSLKGPGTQTNPESDFVKSFGHDEFPPFEDEEQAASVNVLIDTDGNRTDFAIGYYSFVDECWRYTDLNNVEDYGKNLRWFHLPLAKYDKYKVEKVEQTGPLSPELPNALSDSDNALFDAFVAGQASIDCYRGIKTETAHQYINRIKQ